jgi:hypothetical protein
MVKLKNAKSDFHNEINLAGIAQLVEQWTENPRVTSSSLVPGIFLEEISFSR